MLLMDSLNGILVEEQKVKKLTKLFKKMKIDGLVDDRKIIVNSEKNLLIKN